jgi:hypothetical protein
MASLSSLPDDMFGIISSFLYSTEVCHLSRVDKECHASNKSNLWSRIDYLSAPDELEYEYIMAAGRAGKAARPTYIRFPTASRDTRALKWLLGEIDTSQLKKVVLVGNNCIPEGNYSMLCRHHYSFHETGDLNPALDVFNQLPLMVIENIASPNVFHYLHHFCPELNELD